MLGEDDNVYFLNQDNNVVPYSIKRNEFRNEILIKNILAGITPLFIKKENGFNYQFFDDNYEYEVKNADITTRMLFSED